MALDRGPMLAYVMAALTAAHVMLARVLKNLSALAVLLCVSCGGDAAKPSGVGGSTSASGSGGMLSSGGVPSNGGTPGGGGSLAGSGGSLVVGMGGSLVVGMGGSLVGMGGSVAGMGGISSGGTVNGNGGTIGSAGGSVATTGGAAGSGGSMAMGPYPAGPYGNTVGATLINLEMQGYLNESGMGLASDVAPAGSGVWKDAYSLEDVRATGAKYVLIHVSQFF